MDILKDLCHITGEENVLTDELMSRHTTFRIGGPADFFVTPEKKEQIGQIIELCRGRNIPYYIVGNGSNLLVGDRGYRGVIIQVFKKMNQIRTEGEKIYAQAGALLSKVAAAALEASLTGLEFASGIPGTLGGALRMNAGAYGGEMKDVLKEVTVMTEEGDIRVLPAEKLEMGYRTSIIKTAGYIVLEAVISLDHGREEEIQAKMKELADRRIEKQPLEFPSAGSTFKRPEGYFAGKLIMDSGLAGYQIGGAQVSEKHCGFVINTGGATAGDVRALMDYVISIVKEKFGVTLEPEVRFLGDFNRR